MARISIIVEDNAVYNDGVFHDDLDFTSCNIPSDVHALQWQDNAGEIEYKDLHNENITELPAWANNCLAVWQTKEDEPEPEEDPEVVETFWDTYPLAHAKLVDQIVAKEYYGVINTRGVDPTINLKAVMTTLVSEGPTALSSLAQLKDDCIALGVPTISDPLPSNTSANFITYMQGLGYQLSEANRLYLPWSGDIVTNKADQDINIQREIDIENGVVWNGYTWQIDLVSRNNIMNQLTAITSNIYSQPNITWRTKDNIDVTLTIEEFKQLATAVNNKIEEIYLASFNAKT